MEYQEDKGFRLLKFVVKAMGIVLIAGIFFLFFVVAKRIQDPNYMRLNPSCTINSLDEIKIDGKVASFLQSKRELILLINRGSRQFIVTVNSCNGEIIKTIPIVE